MITFVDKVLGRFRQLDETFVPVPPIFNFGFLYNGFVVNDARNICAAGCHIPSKTEFESLITYFGGGAIAGAHLKESGVVNWFNQSVGCDNSSKLNIRGSGGIFDIAGYYHFYSFKANSYLWTSTESGEYYSYIFYCDAYSNSVGVNSSHKLSGYALRLVKDSTILTNGQSGTYAGNDGTVYRTICINGVEWLADNLCETKYRDGSLINLIDSNPNFSAGIVNWKTLTVAARCSYNFNDKNALIATTEPNLVVDKILGRARDRAKGVNSAMVDKIMGVLRIQDGTQLSQNVIFSSPASFSADENQTSVGTVVATSGSTYSIVAGEDSASFAINTNTGVLSFSSAPDFETKNSYTVTIRATKGALTADQTITVTVTNVVEVPGAGAPITSSPITDTTMTVGATLDCKGLSTVWSIEYGLTSSYGSTQAGGTTSVNGAVSVELTGLTQNTLYHWRLKAVNSDGTTYTGDQTATTTNARWIIPVTGRASGTATAGTIVISTTENITPTVTGDVTISTAQASDSTYVKHTITVNCPNNGSGTIIIPDRSKVKSMGAVAASVDFYTGTNTTAPIVTLDLNKIPGSLIKLWQSAGYVDILSITGNSALPSGLTSLILFGAANISWSNNEALPSGLTYIYLFGNNINWTGLNIGSGNVITLNLANYRSSKMSSTDMLTFLAHLTNRTGSLPATITINDYADYASPPQTVVDAVAALKTAKSITTVNLGA